MRCFGPVPSRRLGRSLGINNIPPKICSYACVYCQQGFSSHMQAKRQGFYDPEELFQEAKERATLAQSRGEHIDYLTIVPDGEPTLDINLGKLIKRLQSLNIKVAVISNASLMGSDEVIQEMAQADLVSVKVDAVKEPVWRRVNHPLKELDLEKIKEGLLRFSRLFKGKLITETMLIKDINEKADELEAAAAFISRLSPAVAYLSIPTRPPALKWVDCPREADINQAYQIFKDHLPRVEYLIGFEGSDFSFSGDIEGDILGTCSVHPMREDALRELLGRAGRDWELVERMLAENKIVELDFAGQSFYMRKLYEGYRRS
ncbi:MAG: radical SAM protein [Syntrophomonadaceae bacterium]|nr:radical SAM protein [Syntrophomonadaceae bacterium]